MTYCTPGLFISGTVRSDTRAGGDVVNPATGEVIGRVPHASAADLNEALAAATKAFPIWAKTPALERSVIMRKAADLVRERADSIARILTLEEGKILTEARAEVIGAAEIFEWFAEEGRRNYGRIVPARDAGGRAMVFKEPIGPVAAFTPWNFPAVTPARKIGAALAAGCTMILKAAEETPGTAFELVRAFADAGLPAGVLNLVFGDPAAVSTHLIASPDIRKVSFTGSVAVGKHLMKLCAENLQRTTMELGGHAPVFICADTDLDAAVRMAGWGKFRNAGQACTSPTRFFVQDSVFEEFTERFVAYAKAIKVGDGLLESSTMGPVANDRRMQAMEKLVADAEKRGAQVRAGGKRIGNRGFFYEPTVVAHAPDDSLVMTTEPFGPIAPVIAFKTLDEAIARANSVSVGLAGYAFTQSISVVEKLTADLRVGVLGVNTVIINPPETPFGGVKESGHGSEGGIEGLQAYLDTKFVHQIS